MIPSMDELEATVPDFYQLWRVRDGAWPRGTIASSTFLSNGEDETGVEGYENLKEPKHYIFGGLSLELKFDLFSYLSFDELLYLRLVCQDLALSATANTLHQSYWQSRFLIGQETGFLFPSLTDIRDWSRLFAGSRHLLGLNSYPWSIKRESGSYWNPFLL